VGKSNQAAFNVFHANALREGGEILRAAQTEIEREKQNSSSRNALLSSFQSNPITITPAL
jgi:hypothetical protein